MEFTVNTTAKTYTLNASAEELAVILMLTGKTIQNNSETSKIAAEIYFSLESTIGDLARYPYFISIPNIKFSPETDEEIKPLIQALR